MKKTIQIMMSVCLVLSVAISGLLFKVGADVNGKNQTSASDVVTSEEGGSEDVNIFIDSDFRAVWVPYFDLDMSVVTSDSHFGAFKEYYDSILETASDSGMNTVIVHIHPFGDAFYRSAYFPWTHLLTGEQGKDPGYDAMAYMVEATHKAGLSFHAWINPLRLSSVQTPSALSGKNPRTVWLSDKDIKNDNWSVKTETGIYLNPGYEEVRQYIIDWVDEMADNYDIDAVHLDDYFYPTQASSFDAEAYSLYCSKVDAEALSLAEWRKDNINKLVAGMYRVLHEREREVLLGIAPQGNLDNCEKAAADVKTWVSDEGYVDYICPQLYYNSENEICPFEETADTWKKLVTCEKVKLYAGLALYKAGDSNADGGTWVKNDEMISNQLKYIYKNGYTGFALYSYSYLKNAQTSAEMENILDCLTPITNVRE